MPYSYKPLMFFGILIVFVELFGIPNDWKANIIVTAGFLMIIFALLYKFYNKVMGESRSNEYKDGNVSLSKPVLQSVDEKRAMTRKYNRLVS